MQRPFLPIVGPGSGLDGETQKEASFSTRRGGQRPGRLGLAWAAETRGGASRIPGAPLGGPLPAPKSGPSLHPWGGADFSTGGRDSAKPFSNTPPPPPPSPEPLKHREGQGRLGPRWRGGERPRPAPCLLTLVRFLLCSGRDGGEKTAVTCAGAVPCTPSSPQRSLPPSPAAAGLAVQ